MIQAADVHLNLNTFQVSNMDAAHTEPCVRLATLFEIETISEIAGRAFIHDPVFNYFNNVDHVSRVLFIILLSTTIDSFEAFDSF